MTGNAQPQELIYSSLQEKAKSKEARKKAKLSRNTSFPAPTSPFQKGLNTQLLLP